MTILPLDTILPLATVPKAVALHPLHCLYLTVCMIDTYHKLHCSTSLPPHQCAHIDSGSMAASTHQLDLLYYYHEYTTPESKTVPLLCVADAESYHPHGISLLRVPTTSKNFVFVPTYYTPDIPATILSPDAAAQAYGCTSYLTCSEFTGKNCYLRL